MSVTADCPICKETLNAANKGVIPYSLFSHAANNHEGFMENIGCIGKICPYCTKEVRDEYQLCTHIISHTRPWIRIANKYPNFPLPKKYRDEVHKRLENNDIPNIEIPPTPTPEPTETAEAQQNPSHTDTSPDTTPDTSTPSPPDPETPTDQDTSQNDPTENPSPTDKKGEGQIEKVDLNDPEETPESPTPPPNATGTKAEAPGLMGSEGSAMGTDVNDEANESSSDTEKTMTDKSSTHDGSRESDISSHDSRRRDGAEEMSSVATGEAVPLNNTSINETSEQEPNIPSDKMLQTDSTLENLLEFTQNFINSSDRGSGGGGATVEASPMSGQSNQIDDVKELLSDAVDDMIDKKLNEKDNLNRIANNLEGLDKGQEQFQNEITNLSQEVKNTVSNVQNDVSNLNEEIEGKMNEIDNDVKETVNTLDEKVNQKVDKIDEDVSQKVDKIDSEMTERVNQVHQQLETIDDRIEENISEFSEERKQILTEAEKARLEDLQVVANQINEGFQEIGTKLAETFERKTEPEDAVTHDQFKNTMTQMQNNIQEVLTETKQELEPALAVAQNFKQAVGQAPCDNCGKPVTIDQVRCDNCGGQVYWEL